jgi:hypothetical protein
MYFFVETVLVTGAPSATCGAALSLFTGQRDQFGQGPVVDAVFLQFIIGGLGVVQRGAKAPARLRKDSGVLVLGQLTGVVWAFA